MKFCFIALFGITFDRKWAKIWSILAESYDIISG